VSSKAHDPLQLVHDFTLRVRSGVAELEGPRGRCSVPLEGLFQVLAAFERPTSASRALAAIRGGGAGDTVEQETAARELQATGVIGDPSAAAPPGGFADPEIHARMLHDSDRVEAYLEAIAQVVRPGDVVVDLGTGTGILAVAAARAGARRVYAIEESAIADVAEEVFVRNGVADRVTLVRGHSTRVQLPERANVLVTETLGNDPLGEAMLVYIDDARRRLLAPGARILPSQLRLAVHALGLPPDRVPALDEETIEGWRTRYGIDLGPLWSRHAGATTHLSENANTASTFSRVGEPTPLEHLDLAGEISATAEREISLLATCDAPRVGLALGYDVQLAESVALAVGPHGPPGSHWGFPVFAPLAPTGVVAGETIAVRFSRSLVRCWLDLIPR